MLRCHMALKRNQLHGDTAQVDASRPAIREDSELLELDVVQLEERVAPACKPPIKLF